MSYNHQHHYGHQQAGVPMYPEHGEYADIDEPAVSDARPEIFPVSHPLFTREEISNTRALDHYPSSQSPQGWTPYESPFHHQPLSYASYPSPPPFPPPRLSPPPTQTYQFKAPGQGVSPGSTSHRLTLAGSLDPATGIFYRTPEHPRLRTAQACEKCRTRKAKCSGEHPSCKRCITRGLICEYAKEGRVRGPNKPKPKSNATTASPCASTSSTSISTAITGKSETRPTDDYGSRAAPRPPSSHSSGGSSDQAPNDAPGQSLFLPPAPGDRTEYAHHRSSSSSPPLSVPSFSRGHNLVPDSGSSTSISRHNSFDEHRSPRSHLMDAHMNTAPSLFRLSGASIAEETGLRLASSSRSDIRTNDVGPGMSVRSLPEDTQFYPYQQHSLIHHLQRPVNESVHHETSSSRSGQNLQRYQHLDQRNHQYHSQRDAFPTPTYHQYESARNAGGDVHALSPVAIAQSRRMSSLRIGTAQVHQPYLTQNPISAHQQFGGHQPQQHNLVPIQLGSHIPGEVHRPTLQHEIRGELAYTHSPAGVVPFFDARGHIAEHERQGRVPECGPDEHQSEYHLHNQLQHPQPQPQPQHRSLPDSQMTVPQIHPGLQRPQPEYPVESQPYDSRDILARYASSRTVSTASSTSSVDPSSPLTTVNASASGGDMLLYHYTAASNAPSRLSSELHGMQPSGSTMSSLASLRSTHDQAQSQPEGGGELHASHSAGGGEGESRLVNSGAVQQRGSGHDHSVLSVSRSHSAGGHVYGSESTPAQIFREGSGGEFKLC